MQTLPTQDIDENAIYLVPIQDPQTSDNYAEYIYLNGVWEKLGETPIEIDLTDYVKNTDYASTSKGGVVKISNYYGTNITNDGIMYGTTKTFSQYEDGPLSSFISKGTLENIITGKGLVSNTNYAGNDTAGVIKGGTDFKISNNGYPWVNTFSFSDYINIVNGSFISKGTLENVIAGKGLVSNTDYATDSTTGVIKSRSSYGFGVSNSGLPYAVVKNLTDYNSMNDASFIGKGTLENVLAEYYKKQVVLTQAEYDQITPDANTLYFITD